MKVNENLCERREGMWYGAEVMDGMCSYPYLDKMSCHECFALDMTAHILTKQGSIDPETLGSAKSSLERKTAQPAVNQAEKLVADQS